MTRSDIILEKFHAKTIEEKDVLIEKLHYKIENVYSILFGVEGFKTETGINPFEDIAKILRKALES